MNLITLTIKCIVIVLSVTTTAIPAAELLVIEQDDCPYCKKFNFEIAQAYPNTAEGTCAPLRRIDLHEPWPMEYEHIQAEQFTPTFILINDGEEIDRLIGYPGDEYFWFLLGEMLQKLPPEKAC